MEALKPEAPCCVYDLKIMIFVRLYSANLNKFTAITQIPRVKIIILLYSYFCEFRVFFTDII